jgi:hypothetical protein
MRRLLRERRCSPAFVVSLLALFIALTGVGYAATGGSLILGHTNSTSNGTALRSRGGPTLALTNRGGRPAASFNVLRGKPPFAVNSRTKVTGLSADLLDGIDSSAFQRRVRSCAAGSAISEVNADGSVVCVTASAISPSWSLTGNAGTTPGTNFLGTTDAQPLVIKTNNTEALRIDTSGNLGIGTATPGARVDALSNPGIAVRGTSQTSSGVSGSSSTGSGVVGTSTSHNGLLGTSNTGDGVDAISSSGHGINALSTSGRGVNAVSKNGTGVFGTSTSGDGVAGASTSAPGVAGTSTSNDGVAGVSGTGYGVVGATTSGAAGVIGRGAHNGVLGTSSHVSGGGTNAAVLAINTSTGDIFIGENNIVRVARINGSGKAFFNGGEQTGGADYAESMQASVNTKTLTPGDVLAIDPRHGNEVRLSDSPDSQLVAGVYSTKPSVLAIGNHNIDDSLAGNVPVAMLGVVPTKVSAENGAVKPGDLLTTARTPGYAMKAKSVIVSGVTLYPTGAILGKALQPLRGGRGVIGVLVTLR